MLKRDITKTILKLAKKYPVITVTGPRQSGKTTLIREIFPQHTYVNLENLREQNFAENDPESFLARFTHGAIIDEIQRVPKLTSYIQVIVDERKKEGMFILSGSQNFSLINSINQSLAGRTALFELLPFSFNELKDSKYFRSFNVKKAKDRLQLKTKLEKLNMDKLMLKGFYPRIYDKNIPASDFYADYVKTYAERDLGEIKTIHNLSAFKKFMRMCASRIGQVLNLNNISNDLGVSSTTLKDWLNILEASYLVYLLEPYYENINKQLTKSPKLYFIDTGLLCYLLGINSEEELNLHPLRGNIFENLIVIEYLKSFLNKHKAVNLCFYRDKQHEIDILYRTEAGKLSIAEVKSASTVIDEFSRGLNYLKKVLADKVSEQKIIYDGSECYEQLGIKIRNLEGNEFL